MAEAFLKSFWWSWHHLRTGHNRAISKATCPSSLTGLRLRRVFVSSDRITRGGKVRLSVDFALEAEGWNKRNGSRERCMTWAASTVLIYSCIEANENSHTSVKGPALQSGVKAWSLISLGCHEPIDLNLRLTPPCLISSITLFRGHSLLCAIWNTFAPLKLWLFFSAELIKCWIPGKGRLLTGSF